MGDQSSLRLYNDRLPEIGSFFYNQTRTGAFATQATNIFRYQPNTIPVPQAIVDDAERSAAMAANSAALGEVLRNANGPVVVGVQGGGLKDFSPNLDVPPLPPTGGGGRGEATVGKHSTFAAVNPGESLFAIPGRQVCGRRLVTSPCR